MAPPSNAASTSRPSTVANPNNRDGLLRTAQRRKAGVCRFHGLIERLSGQEIAQRLDCITEGATFIFDPPPAVTACPDGTGMMCGCVAETNQNFGGPAMDPDRAVGKAVKGRQGFELGECGVDELQVTGKFDTAACMRISAVPSRRAIPSNSSTHRVKHRPPR
jgi:hypothetical protein